MCSVNPERIARRKHNVPINLGERLRHTFDLTCFVAPRWGAACYYIFVSGGSASTPHPRLFYVPPLAAGALQRFRFSIQGEYSLTIATLLYRSCLKNPTQCFVGVCFSRRVNRRALGKFQWVLVYIYRNPSSNVFFLLAGSPCGKRSKLIKIDQLITGCSSSFFFRSRNKMDDRFCQTVF